MSVSNPCQAAFRLVLTGFGGIRYARSGCVDAPIVEAGPFRSQSHQVWIQDDPVACGVAVTDAVSPFVARDIQRAACGTAATDDLANPHIDHLVIRRPQRRRAR